MTRTHASKALTRLIERKPGPGSILCFLFLFAAVSVPALPAQETWVNLRDLGAKGDGVTDDTEALRAAIAGRTSMYRRS